jgi:hypothetical protein
MWSKEFYKGGKNRIYLLYTAISGFWRILRRQRKSLVLVDTLDQPSNHAG